jgi:hypothetical protein
MSELEAIKTLNNPISDLISDDIYDMLNSRGLIHERAVRDYRIRVKFKQQGYLPRLNYSCAHCNSSLFAHPKLLNR